MARYRLRYLIAVVFFIFLTVILPLQPKPYLSDDDEFSSSLSEEPVLPSLCLGKMEHVRILLVVGSQIAHRDNRNHVRKIARTRPECSIRPVFLFGKFIGESRGKLDLQLQEENSTTGDILQVDIEWDYRIKGLTGVQVIQAWVKNQTCIRFDQVVFGKYDAQYSQIFKDNAQKYDTNWELDECLKFAHRYENSVQFSSAYFPPKDSFRNVTWSQNLTMDTTFSYQKKVVSPHNYRLLMGDSAMCGPQRNRDKYFAVIAAHSAPGNWLNRKMIRASWGAKTMLKEYKMLLIFFVGVNRTWDDEQTQQLKAESAEHGDLVQYDFDDSYKNMTLKQISLLKFMTQFCSKVRYSFVLKTDDDIVIDLKSLHNYFTLTVPTQRISARRTIFCAHMNGPAIAPRYEDKWFVSRQEYPANLYPSYCSGAGYLITKDLIADLYTTSLHVAKFWVDDTFVSGVLAKAAGDVALVQMPKQHLIPQFTLKRKKDVTQVKKMFVHVGQNRTMFDIFWRALASRHGLFQADVRE